MPQDSAPFSASESAPGTGLAASRQAVDLVILAGSIGSDGPWTAGLSRPFLPLPGTTIIEALLAKLRPSFDGTCTICANGQTDVFANRLAPMAGVIDELALYQDALPCGTAGCIKACQSRFQGDVILVAGASVWLEGDPQWMVEQHRAQGNALTVFCTAGAAGNDAPRNRHFRPTGVYCCHPEVLNFVPERGYRDLKEQLVPALRQAGLKVGAVVLENQTREVLDWNSYLHALARALSESDSRLPQHGYSQLAPGIWVGNNVQIASQARIIGPVLLGHGCTVADDAIIMGPSILGDKSHVDCGAHVYRIVAPQGVHVSAGVSVFDQLVQSTLESTTPEADSYTTWPIGERSGLVSDHSAPLISDGQSEVRQETTRRSALNAMALIGSLAALFIWTFWYSFVELWQVWQTNGDYGAGQLVPFAAAYMIFNRRVSPIGLAPEINKFGLALFGLGAATNLFGCFYLFASLQNLGIVIGANGLVMMLLGRQGYRAVRFPMLFLLLMIPLPGRIHDAVVLPLQGFCAMVSAGLLEVIGVPIVRHGHVLEITGHQIAVAEACNGLRMAVAFVIVAGVVAFLVRRPAWQKAAILISSVPIAILSNVLRVVLTACLYGTSYEWIARGTMHELSGLLMMPVALGMMLLELWLFTKLAQFGHSAKTARSGFFGYGPIPSLGDTA